jgi:hypothetical protein
VGKVFMGKEIEIGAMEFQNIFPQGGWRPETVVNHDGQLAGPVEEEQARQ